MFLLQNEQWFPLTSFRTRDRSFYTDSRTGPELDRKWTGPERYRTGNLAILVRVRESEPDKIKNLNFMIS